MTHEKDSAPRAAYLQAEGRTRFRMAHGRRQLRRLHRRRRPACRAVRLRRRRHRQHAPRRHRQRRHRRRRRPIGGAVRLRAGVQLISIAEPEFTQKAVDDPLLQVPPARRGNRTLARFPSRSGGNLRRGGSCELWRRSWYKSLRLYAPLTTSRSRQFLSEGGSKTRKRFAVAHLISSYPLLLPRVGNRWRMSRSWRIAFGRYDWSSCAWKV
jgi:hypothetical protein